MFDAIEAGYPHLIRALRRGCGLTHREAVAAIFSHVTGDRCGDACAHIRAAIAERHARGFRPLRTIREA
jgi:hypothetical protein